MKAKHLQISPSWVFKDGEGNSVDPLLFTLLRAIHRDGKLTRAAQDSGHSYRHCWNLVNKWSAFFGADLVIMEQGRGARLSSLGEKLMWAERRAAARFEPEMQNLASDLNLALQQIMAGDKPLLSIHASHGYAVALLPRFCRDIDLDLHYTSAAEALKSLDLGYCEVAGFHLPAGERVDRLQRDYLRHLDPERHCLIRFATRNMGLHVLRGNPRAITGVADLCRPELRFINREPSSGSRMLLEHLLASGNIDPAGINGFDWVEYTHSAVAAHIAAGLADTGFGIETAGRQFGLDFIDITSEHYLWACLRDNLRRPAVAAFLNTLRDSRFADAVDALPGYSAESCGQVQPLEELFG